MQGIPNNKLQFKPDQRLEDEELARQLFQNEPLEASPRYWGSLIKFNSTYLESPDVVYGQQGWLTMWCGVVVIAFLVAGTSSYTGLSSLVFRANGDKDIFGLFFYLHFCRSLFSACQIRIL